MVFLLPAADWNGSGNFFFFFFNAGAQAPGLDPYSDSN